jgi:hypothetical protein
MAMLDPSSAAIAAMEISFVLLNIDNPPSRPFLAHISLGALSLYAVTVEVAVRSDTQGSIPSPDKIPSVRFFP